MAKFANKQSKRKPARLRYKIEKKVAIHNRKLRRQQKKDGPKKQKLIQVPNICPFKEDILKDVEAYKKQKEEERKKLREAAKLEKKKPLQSGDLTTMVSSASMREKIHEAFQVNSEETQEKVGKRGENSLKAYYKEFKKVIEAADVILEVVDARDPLGSKSPEVKQAVEQGGKRLVLILNKADLIPRENLDKWLKYLRKNMAVVALPFKSSTQKQSNKLGQKKFVSKEGSEKITENSASVGAELLISLLKNYCRNKDVKTSIRVGVVGLPNVGKSSLINSLKRSKTCNVGATPGVTRTMQEVHLDKDIKLLDSPGIVFSSASDASSSLRNAVKVSSLSDPIKPATAILQRVPRQKMMEMYDVTEYHTPTEFFTFLASRMGRFKKGGVPNSEAAARILLEDWNKGKIKYFTLPPEVDLENIHVSSAIVSTAAKDFDLNEFESMESETIDQISNSQTSRRNEFIEMDTSKELRSEVTVQRGESENLISEDICVEPKKTKKVSKTKKEKPKKVDPVMQLEGNLQLNRVKKLKFKKEKKLEKRKLKVATALSNKLQSVSFNVTNVSNSLDDEDCDM